MNTAELSCVCKQMRRDIITMVSNAGSGHPGGSLSMVELIASVFCNHMRIDPKDPKPALDYVVTKMPRFPFDKFTDANQKLGTQILIITISNLFSQPRVSPSPTTR